MLLTTQHTTEYSREKKTMERDENVSEFKICPNESSTHQFALVQTAGGDGGLFASPVRVWRVVKLSL